MAEKVDNTPLSCTMPSRFPVAVDLFAGAGGLSEGLMAAGISVAVAVEHHPHPALTYAFNHPEARVICDSVKVVSANRLMELVLASGSDSQIDLVTGGPPCQGFSPAGKRDVNDPRNSLFRDFLRLVQGLKPRMFLFENVPGFAKLYDGVAIKELLKGFRRIGYEVRGASLDSLSAEVVNAANFGVPQHRKRFLLVGWQKDAIDNEFEWPAPTHGVGDSRKLAPFVTVAEALADLEFLKSGEECHAYLLPPTSDYQRARRHRSQGIFNHLATNHLSSTMEMFKRIKPGSNIRSIPEEHRSGKQTMTRLDANACSKSVLALPDDFIHYKQHRIPTVREMARLQSFDDSYVFLGRRTTCDKNRRIDVPQYTQVGNAVPPLLAKAIGVALVKALGYEVRDLRDFALREERAKWLQGSSAYSGYSLKNGLNDVYLSDAKGKLLELPVFAGGEHPCRSQKVNRWTEMPRNKARAS